MIANYRLCIMHSGEKPENCEYYIMTSQYTLLLAENEIPRNAVELTAKETESLSDVDRLWLAESILLIRQKYYKKNSAIFVPLIDERIKAFEKELENASSEYKARKGEKKCLTRKNK